DVHLGAVAVAHGLAVEQHRRLVLLALADHDGAVHADGVHEGAHRVDRGAVGPVLVAGADPAAAGDGGGFGHADQLEGEVAVGGGGGGGRAGHGGLLGTRTWVESGTGTCRVDRPIIA